MLLDLLYAESMSPLGRLANFLVRFEDLSHVLVWTRSKVTYAAQPCKVWMDVVPLSLTSPQNRST